MPRLSPLVIILLGMGVYLALACYKLDHPGLYYDELHQAPTAFCYVGTPPTFFTNVMLGDIPLMNMSYSGAIKSALYGLYLKFVSPQFSVISWRLLGILFVCAGLLGFAVLGRKKLTPAGAALFCLLFVTDATILLGTRHDWGPIALSLMLRMLMLGIYLGGMDKEQVSKWSSFFLGALLGFAVYEKLSGVVLLIPVALLLLIPKNRRTLGHILAAVLGGIVGSSPLALANILTWTRKSYLLSVSDVKSAHVYSLGDILRQMGETLSLGHGREARLFILGQAPPEYAAWIEGALLSLLLIATAWIAWRFRASVPRLRAAGLLLLCYFTSVLSVWLLPQNTFAHHWILGTPFHYAALMLAFDALRQRSPDGGPALKRAAVVALSVLLLVFVSQRVVTTLGIERDIARERSALWWDPSLTKLGEFTETLPRDSAIIAASWGVASQMFCLSNGRPFFVFEAIWDDIDEQGLAQFIVQTRRNAYYVVELAPPPHASFYRTMRLRELINSFPYWREVPVEPEAQRFTSAHVRKFIPNYE